MKLPNLFFKLWNDDQTEPDMPKLGIDWWARKGCDSSPWAGVGMYLIFFGYRLDITFATNGRAYTKDMEDWTGVALLPYSKNKRKV